jgi:hypothetical protein
MIKHLMSFDFEEMVKIIKRGETQELTLLGEIEWQPLPDQQLTDAFREYSVDLVATHCGMEHSYYKKIYDDAGVNARIELWPTFWLHHTELCLKNEGWDHRSNIIDLDFEYDFICMNNRGHRHRCRLIDELSREELIDKGVVTWVDCLNEANYYKFNHFDNRKITLSDNFDTRLDSFILPQEFHKSFFHLVTECNEETFVLSEKTAKVLLFKKFFIVQGSTGFHQRLKGLGFKLFDNLIDYSFDLEPDRNLRTKKIVESLKCIINIKDKKAAFESIQSVLEHNYKRCLEIMNDPKHVPDIYKELVNNKDLYPEIETSFYENIINRNKL